MAGAHGLLCRLTDRVDQKLLDAAGVCRAGLGRILRGVLHHEHISLLQLAFELIYSVFPVFLRAFPALAPPGTCCPPSGL